MIEKVCSFLLLIIFLLAYPSSIEAKSGCCSGHGGVNCGAGAQSNGNVICNDGWTGSSCDYAGMVMCGGSSGGSVNTQPVVQQLQPTAIPTSRPIVATRAPTRIPTRTPTPKPTSTLAPTSIPTETTTPTIEVTRTETIAPTEVPKVESAQVLGTTTPQPNFFVSLFNWLFRRK